MIKASLTSATKRFGETVAVDGVSLEVEDGEFVVLLGPTGAGKTTTLRLFAGLETPDKGRVTIAGSDVTRLGPAERDVAFVFQQYSLYPHLTVFENLAFPLKAPGRRVSAAQIRKRVEEIAELLRIAPKLKNRVTALSGGEMQRVSIGRALVREPNLFLMDEPLSSLDAKLREDLRLELKRIQRDLGATIVYVTHDQLEAMTLADRIGVLAEGRLVQIDTPRVVYERPANIYAAQRLGSPQINLVAPTALAVGEVPGGAAQVGVRPEDVVVAPREGTNGVANAPPKGVPGEILTVEHFGVETIALIDIGGRQVHALLGPRTTLTQGMPVAASVRPGAALYFDATGARL
ncbi:ABC transporter ATP-binding protein [Acuticoccus mangrovi]|uniref:ABC transporter ATP-binding protein n=1 Tax=Acuticoccus mangrovi TaxID=2796142 RepID=A0A934IKX9_9HYPH|nr:ABC transporter ATP-binding protein [Acuticoccus mangrovi]MBJ3774530.1 ABC transporter ATP-binding protein [Acuticoccus mangrovi]